MTGHVPPALKIVRIIARLNIGGPARHVVLLNGGLRDRGHATLLVHGSIAPGEGSFERLAETAAVPTRRISSLGRSVSPFADLRAFAQVVRVLFRERPDVVHTHTAKAGTIGRLAALAYNATRPKTRRCAVVHTFHGHVLEAYFSPLVNRLLRSVERSLALVTDRIVAISAGQARDLVERFEIVPAERVAIVPLGLDLDVMSSGDGDLRRELDLAGEQIVVGYAGRLVAIKDLGALVRAFAAARERCRTLSLVIAGDGPERAALEALAASLGLSDVVRFPGWVDDLPRLYRTFDVFVLSSLNEGTPVSLIEAMASGRAVIATHVGGVPDVVDAGRSGLLVPPRDERRLADAVVQLASSAELRRALGRAAQSAVLGAYGPGELVSHIEAVYQDILREKRTVPARRWARA